MRGQVSSNQRRCSMRQKASADVVVAQEFEQGTIWHVGQTKFNDGTLYRFVNASALLDDDTLPDDVRASDHRYRTGQGLPFSRHGIILPLSWIAGL
jgi:hypothetical protein